MAPMHCVLLFVLLHLTGREIRFDLGRLEGYRNFCNKLWNAARYVLMNTENFAADLNDKECEYSFADRWIMSRLNKIIPTVRNHLDTYRFDLAAQWLYDFTWNEFCDWYLEFSKLTLNNPDSTEKEKRGTRYTLITTLESLLRLIHPFMPFITEEIWQRVKKLAGKKGGTIQLELYPVSDKTKKNDEVEIVMAYLQILIVQIRRVRDEMNIAPAKLISLILDKGDDLDMERINKHQTFLKKFAKLDSIHWLAPNEELPPSKPIPLGNLNLYIPYSGLIDVAAETTRLQKEIAKLETELERSENKLTNENYVAKAPAEVVAKERERVAEIQNILENYKEQLSQLHKTV